MVAGRQEDRFLPGSRAGEDLHTIRANGTDIRQFTDLPQGEVFPRYSPDGTTLAYTGRLGPDFSGFSVHLIRRRRFP
jgi:hypothetical protein